MNKVLLVCLFLLVGCASVQTTKNSSSNIKVTKIAITPFSGSDQELNMALADALGTELMGMGYDLIERGQLEQVLAEQKLSWTGVMPTSTAIKLGEILNVDALLVGSVMPYEPGAKEISMKGQVLSANVRLIDTHTGRVAASTSFRNGTVFSRFPGAVRSIADSLHSSLH